MSAPIDIRVEGATELVAALDKLQGHNADALLRNAMSKGGSKMRIAVKNETPEGGPGGRVSSPTHPGDLKKSISMKRGRRSRPPAAIIYAKKTYWYSKWVIRGTAPHRIRFPDQAARGVRKQEGNIEHPGIKRPNPYMDRGGKAGTPAALKAITRYIGTYIESLD